MTVFARWTARLRDIVQLSSSRSDRQGACSVIFAGTREFSLCTLVKSLALGPNIVGLPGRSRRLDKQCVRVDGASNWIVQFLFAQIIEKKGPWCQATLNLHTSVLSLCVCHYIRHLRFCARPQGSALSGHYEPRFAARNSRGSTGISTADRALLHDLGSLDVLSHIQGSGTRREGKYRALQTRQCSP